MTGCAMCRGYRLSQWAWVFLIPLVLSNPIFPGLKRHKLLKLKVPDKIKSDIREQQVQDHKMRMKDLILQSLNISRPPSPRTLPVTPKKKVNVNGSHASTNAQKYRNVSLILSQATDPYRRDFMVFKIHSKVRSQLSHIETPVIILRLKLNSKRLSSKKKKKQSIDSFRTKMYDNLCNNYKNKLKNNSTSVHLKSSRRVPKGASNLLNATKICEGLSRGKKISNRKRRSKGRKIRIIVRVVDPNTNKKSRIFVGRILLKRFKTVSVPVPRNIFRTAAESEDHSLVVQVSCRNCKRYVKMDRVYRKGNKKIQANDLRLNPDRPYLYIITVNDNTDTDKSHIEGHHRSKRDLSSPNSCYNLNNILERRSNNILFDENYHLQCCEARTYYTFEELGLSDIVVFPLGFYSVDCVGECRASRGNLPSSQEYAQDAFNTENNIDATTDPSDSHQKCISTSKSSLEILYFVNSTTIIPKRLENLIGDSCGCASG